MSEANDRTFTQGYSEYSQFASIAPEFANFPRFDDLAYRNLVHLAEQARSIRGKLQLLDDADKASLKESLEANEKSDLRNINRSWAVLENAGRNGNARARTKLRLAKRLEVVMNRYQKALLNHSAIMQLPPPQPHAFDIARDWAEQRKPFIHGDCYFEDREQLVSLHRAIIEDDLLSRFVKAVCGSWFPQPKQLPKDWPKMNFFNDNKTKVVTSVLSVVIAVILLFGATAVLTFASDVSRAERMAIIGSFTTAFALLIGILTNCRRSELFVAVATYSAVLVVFAEVTKDDPLQCVVGGTLRPCPVPNSGLPLGVRR